MEVTRKNKSPLPCCIDRISIAGMAFLPRPFFGFTGFTTKILVSYFFPELENKADLKIHVETQETLKSQRAARQKAEC